MEFSRRRFLGVVGAAGCTCGLPHSAVHAEEVFSGEGFCAELVSLEDGATEFAIEEFSENALDPSQPPEAAAYRAKRWNPKRTSLKVGLLSQPNYVDRVIASARKWEPYTGVSFDFVGDGEIDILVDFSPGGSWSYLGTDSKIYAKRGDRSMNFGWLKANSSDSEFDRVVIHEFGHALSLVHEHKRPDTKIDWNVQAVYDYYKKNYPQYDEKWVKNNVLDRYQSDVLNWTTPYDRKSIMHYAIPAALLMDPSGAVAWNTELSKKDEEFADWLFG